jgi:hypothetical protein
VRGRLATQRQVDGVPDRLTMFRAIRANSRPAPGHPQQVGRGRGDPPNMIDCAIGGAIACPITQLSTGIFTDWPGPTKC